MPNELENTRSDNEIVLTQKLASALTLMNIQRLQLTEKKLTENQQLQLLNSQSLANTLFVTLSGIPPFQNEFASLNLPKQIHQVHISFAGFQQNLSDAELQQRTYSGNLYKMADEINQKIKKYESHISHSINNFVFIYHSYGTFVLAYYLKVYGQIQKNKIKGLIEIGAVPIRIYDMLDESIKQTKKFNEQYIRENINVIFQEFRKTVEKLQKMAGVKFSLYKNKYSLLSVLISYKTKDFNDVFEWLKRFPKVLKLFIYGQNDIIFDPKKLDEKVIYYTYHKDAELDRQYETQLKKKFEGGLKTKNIDFKPTSPDYKLQERFIYKVPFGKHSLHHQKQCIPTIQKAVKQYLSLIL